MPLLLLVALVGLPIAELYVIIRVGQEIGPLLTVAALACTSLIGIRLVRAQGRAVVGEFAASVAGGRPPARAALDGALVFVGGALLIVPGFLTDFVGAVLLAPPSRALVRTLIVRHYAGRLVAHLARAGAGRGRPSQVYDVDGRAIEIDADKLPL